MRLFADALIPHRNAAHKRETTVQKRRREGLKGRGSRTSGLARPDVIPGARCVAHCKAYYTSQVTACSEGHVVQYSTVPYSTERTYLNRSGIGVMTQRFHSTQLCSIGGLLRRRPSPAFTRTPVRRITLILHNRAYLIARRPSTSTSTSTTGTL